MIEAIFLQCSAAIVTTGADGLQGAVCNESMHCVVYGLFKIPRRVILQKVRPLFSSSIRGYGIQIKGHKRTSHDNICEFANILKLFIMFS